MAVRGERDGQITSLQRSRRADPGLVTDRRELRRRRRTHAGRRRHSHYSSLVHIGRRIRGAVIDIDIDINDTTRGQDRPRRRAIRPVRRRQRRQLLRGSTREKRRSGGSACPIPVLPDQSRREDVRPRITRRRRSSFPNRAHLDQNGEGSQLIRRRRRPGDPVGMVPRQHRRRRQGSERLDHLPNRRELPAGRWLDRQRSRMGHRRLAHVSRRVFAVLTIPTDRFR